MNDRHRSLEEQLQDAYRVEPPDALKQRLLAIPDEVPQAARKDRSGTRRSYMLPAWLAAFDWRLAVPALCVIAVVAIVWTAGLRLAPVDTPPEVDAATRIAQEQAVRDFIIAMNYLQISTARANAAVQGELGAGLMIAFERGEQSFKDTSNRVTNGG
jgi:anti-sigma-K factor RskA